MNDTCQLEEHTKYKANINSHPLLKSKRCIVRTQTMHLRDDISRFLTKCIYTVKCVPLIIDQTLGFLGRLRSYGSY